MSSQSEGKIRAIDGDKLAEYLKSSIDLTKKWSSESDYKRGLKDERRRTLDGILEHILTGTFALTAPPRDLTPEFEKLLRDESAFFIGLVHELFRVIDSSGTYGGTNPAPKEFVEAHRKLYLEKLDEIRKREAKADEAQKESK